MAAALWAVAVSFEAFTLAPCDGIEPVWNSLKRYLSPISTESADEFRALIEATFLELTQRLSFAADWLETFIDINRLR